MKRYLKNKTREPRGWRYTSKMYDFRKLIQNISSKCYEIVREVYILPTIDSLDQKFSDEEKHLRKLLKHVESIPQLIEIYKEIYQVPGNFEYILSVDAASLDRPNEHSHSHVFVLYLQPVNQYEFSYIFTA